MFELTTPIKAKLINLEVLSQKNRQPDENPGAKLTIGEINLPADQLAHFDGALRSALFTRQVGGAGQGALEGMESEKLTSLGAKVGTIRWKDAFAGYTLTIDRGMGGKSNLTIVDCEISGIRLTPKDGGSCTLKMNVESSDVSEALFGKLAKLKSCETQIMLSPPETKDDLATPPSPAAPKAKPARAAKPDPTAAFVEANGSEPAATQG